MASNPGTNPGFTLAEDSALKARLAQSIQVTDDKNANRVVQAFFRHPDSVTEKTYPYLTIELIDIVHATERQHSLQYLYFPEGTGLTPDEQAERTTIDYYPSEYDAADLSALAQTSEYLVAESYTPVDLIYQITTYARTQKHDRQMLAKMFRRIAPLHGRGWMEIPEDGTIRRLDLVDYRSADILDNEAGYKKRTFRKVYTIVINSELATTDLADTKRVATTDVTLSGHTDTVSTDPFTTEGL